MLLSVILAYLRGNQPEQRKHSEKFALIWQSLILRKNKSGVPGLRKIQ
jgi:hypothetical protein